MMQMELPDLKTLPYRHNDSIDSKLPRGRTHSEHFKQSRRLPNLLTPERSSSNFLAGKENLWDSRKQQACQSLLEKFDQIEYSQKPSTNNAFFIPLDGETSILNDVTNVSSRLHAESKDKKCQIEKATGYFLPLDLKSVNKNEVGENRNENQHKDTKNLLNALKETGTCFYCGRGVNEYNKSFHNDAKCQKVVREKTFLISSKHDLSANDSWPKPNPSVKKNLNNAIPQFDSKDLQGPILSDTDLPLTLEPWRSNQAVQMCKLCGKCVTRWTVDFHRNKLCQQAEMSRQRTMMILRNPDQQRILSPVNQSFNQRDTLEMWCPVGLRNSQELESLKNLMQAPIFVHGKDCSLCGKWFGTKSLPIHLNQCKKRFRIRNSIT